MEKKALWIIAVGLIVSVGGLSYLLYRTSKEQIALIHRIEAIAEQRHVTKHVQPAVQPINRAESWTELQARLKNSVVQVMVQVAQFDWLEPYKTPEQGQGSGSGFFINDQGYLITNAHVVDQATAISIMVPEFGKELLDAEVICVAPERDLALVKLKETAVKRFVDRLGAIPFMELGDSNSVRRADEIMTLGYPLGQTGLKSTTGVVSGRENAIGRSMIQIDAPINHGNSGGPALDTSGKVIGINTAGINAAGTQNVGYIIPINELKLILDGMFNSQEKLLRKPYLGIFCNAGSAALTEFLHNPHPGGYYVNGVSVNGVAAKAGIKEGDMIYQIDGHRIDMYGQIDLPWSEDKISFADYLSFVPHGKEIKLAAYRQGKRLEFAFNFEQPELPAIRAMHPMFEAIDYEIFGGMVIMELSRNQIPLLINLAPELIVYEDVRNQMEPVLVITHILPDSVGQRSRLILPGARLKEVNGVAVKTLVELRKALEKSLTDNFVRIKLYSNYFAVFPLEQVLQDELRLAPIFHYPVSPIVQKMLKLRAFHAQQQAQTGSSSQETAS